MTITRETLASIRFGYGFAAATKGPTGPRALMAQLSRPDPYLADPMIAPLAARQEWIAQSRAARLAIKKDRPDGQDMRRAAVSRYLDISHNDLKWLYIRPVTSPESFRERLIAFWADHFTVSALNRPLALGIPDMIQTAIRPNVTGRFGDMLKAVTIHPAMLEYLNQNRSVGPNSPEGKKRDRGLNENLAREILELHTLGVGGSYTQTDVREFAELMTGLRLNAGEFRFARSWAEPGAETVLGSSYGGGKAVVGDILSALDDLATHPDTARHLAKKMVVHFVGAPADEDHIAAVERRYLETDGNLTEVYDALLNHDAAWAPELRKVRTPFELQVATFRALGTRKRMFTKLKRKQAQSMLARPLQAMGQPMMRPNGPDGWPEEPEYWITPAALTARTGWAVASAQRAQDGIDPRELLERVVRDAASPVLSFAIAGAATREEGLALIFASPEFNRR